MAFLSGLYCAVSAACREWCLQMAQASHLPSSLRICWVMVVCTLAWSGIGSVIDNLCCVGGLRSFVWCCMWFTLAYPLALLHTSQYMLHRRQLLCHTHNGAHVSNPSPGAHVRNASITPWSSECSATTATHSCLARCATWQRCCCCVSVCWTGTNDVYYSMLLVTVVLQQSHEEIRLLLNHGGVLGVQGGTQAQWQPAGIF
jgi:hypothetical protein